MLVKFVAVDDVVVVVSKGNSDEDLLSMVGCCWLVTSSPVEIMLPSKGSLVCLDLIRFVEVVDMLALAADAGVSCRVFTGEEDLRSVGAPRRPGEVKIVLAGNACCC